MGYKLWHIMAENRGDKGSGRPLDHADVPVPNCALNTRRNRHFGGLGFREGLTKYSYGLYSYGLYSYGLLEYIVMAYAEL